MGLEVLQVLEQGGIIAYALPARTRGTTQPLDVGLFGPFKSHLLKLIAEAYRLSMKPSNVRSASVSSFDLRTDTRHRVEKFCFRNIYRAWALVPV